MRILNKKDFYWSCICSFSFFASICIFWNWKEYKTI